MINSGPFDSLKNIHIYKVALVVKSISEIIYDKNVPDVSAGRNHGSSSAEVREKFLYKSTDIYKTLN